jgi:DNA polymerase I
VSPRYKKPKKKHVRHGLKDVARRELGVELDKEHQKADWGGEITPEMLEYAAKDSQVLGPLVEALRTKVRETDLEGVLDLERRVAPAMVWMTAAGVPIDEEAWYGYREKSDAGVAKALEKLNGLAPDHPGRRSWKWNSWQQILEAFGLLDIELPNTKKETLSGVDHPLAATLLEYRNAKKRLDVCGQWLSRAHEGRVYALWSQIGAETGRMSCSNPNLQNLHKDDEMRRFVRAPEGRELVKADYSQMELRILAQLSGDPALLEAFEKGVDLHKATAAKMYGLPEAEVTKEQRSSAKAISFGIVYGMSPKGLAARLGIEEEAASTLIEQYFAAHPKVKEYLDSNCEQALRSGTLRTPYGRIRWFGDSSNMVPAERAAVRRAAMNFPIQGACADGLKLALALLWERRDESPGAVPILAVHDEIVVECDEADKEKAEAWLEKAMIDGTEQALASSGVEGPRVPISVEVGSTKAWGQHPRDGQAPI